MKYVNQKNHPHYLYITRQLCDKEEDREKGKNTTISSSGCGLCSAVMVADRLIPNCEFDLTEGCFYLAPGNPCESEFKKYEV